MERSLSELPPSTHSKESGEKQKQMLGASIRHVGRQWLPSQLGAALHSGVGSSWKISGVPSVLGEPVFGMVGTGLGTARCG